MQARTRSALLELQFRNPPAFPKAIAKLSSELGVQLPNEYLELLLQMNGGGGPIGAEGHVVIDPVGVVVDRNCKKRDLIQDEFPGLIVFASDGGDIAYCYDTRRPDTPIVKTSFSDPIEFTPKVVGRNLDEWVSYLISGDLMY